MLSHSLLQSVVGRDSSHSNIVTPSILRESDLNFFRHTERSSKGKVMAQTDLGSEAASAFEMAIDLQSLRSATILISTLPILCVYPFVQKHFVKGIMLGSVKG